MSTKHTPGPWIVDDVEGCIAIAADSDGEVLAYLAQPHQQTNPRSTEEAEANASLIVAAPELLEALSQAIEALRSADPNARMNALRDCPAVVAKATGEAA